MHDGRLRGLVSAPPMDRSVSTDSSTVHGRNSDPRCTAGRWYVRAGFGFKIDFDGTRLLVGAFQESGGQSGGAHFYVFDGTNWVLEQSVVSLEPAGAGYFGSSVAIDGDLAAVGSNDNGNSRGRVDVFKRSTENGSARSTSLHLTVPRMTHSGRSSTSIRACWWSLSPGGPCVGQSGGVWGYDLTGAISSDPIFELTSPTPFGERFGQRLSQGRSPCCRHRTG